MRKATSLGRLLERAADFRAPSPWATSAYCQPRAPRPPPAAAAVLLFPAAASPNARLAALPGAAAVLQEAESVLAGSPAGWAGALAAGLAAAGALAETRAGSAQAVRAAAGRGAGELAALVFAGALHFHDALRLAELVTAAGRQLGAVLRVAAGARLGALLEAEPSLRVAARLHAGTVLLAGPERALQAARGWRGAAGWRRAAGPPGEAARAALQRALPLVRVQEPRLAVMAAGRARPYRSAEEVRALLPDSMMGPHLWEQTLQRMFARPSAHEFPRALCVGRDTRRGLREVNAKAWDNSVLLDV